MTPEPAPFARRSALRSLVARPSVLLLLAGCNPLLGLDEEPRYVGDSAGAGAAGSRVPGSEGGTSAAGVGGSTASSAAGTSGLGGMPMNSAGGNAQSGGNAGEAGSTEWIGQSGGGVISESGGSQSAGGTAPSTGGWASSGGSTDAAGAPNSGGSAGSGGSDGVGGFAGAGASTHAGGSSGSLGGSSGSLGGSSGSLGGSSGSLGGSSGSGGSADPDGFWRQDDWHGCAWVGVGEATNSSVSPLNFFALPLPPPYCIAGTVAAEVESSSFAMLGFNLNEDPSSADCGYDPARPTGPRTPAVSVTKTGLALNFSKQGSDTSFTLRVQLEGLNPANHWCATVTAISGKIFIPWADFDSQCWSADSGTSYSGEDISAVTFVVPGASSEDILYDFCVIGMAAGNSAADAPDNEPSNPQIGTVGTTSSPEGDFDRVKVTWAGEQYIIQNNNWGTPTGTDLILNYFDNSFSVAAGNGIPNDFGVPASFPSIYIGANGETAGGAFSTSSTDSLPRPLSLITGVATTFAWSGNTTRFTPELTAWFANSPPTTVYNDALAATVSVWLRDDLQVQPIGTSQGVAMLAGHTWSVWVGLRGQGPDGFSNAPYITYVPDQTLASLNIDLLDFFDDAIERDYGLTSAMYLTDVFGGFEIWSGGDDLSVEEFTCVVSGPTTD